MVKEKGFREGKKEEIKAKIIEGLTDADWKHLEKQQELSMLEPGSYGYMVAVQNDAGRTQRDAALLEVDKILWSVKNSALMIKRLKKELVGEIVSKLPGSGAIMTEDELQLEIELIEQKAFALTRSILPEMAELRAWAGRHDPAKIEIITLEQFEDYCKKIVTKLEGMGYNLFDDEVRKLYND